jgi:hypothetical protein
MRSKVSTRFLDPQLLHARAQRAWIDTEHFSRSSFALNHPHGSLQRHDEEQLPQNGWEWPKDTWFQSRRDYPPSKIASPAAENSNRRSVADGTAGHNIHGILNFL